MATEKDFPIGSVRKELSTRRIRPTLPDIDVGFVNELVTRWKPQYEHEGIIEVFDEGLAQYALTTPDAHHLFYAALALGKPSIRCTVIHEPNKEPLDVLDQQHNVIVMGNMANADPNLIQNLKYHLKKKGFKFEEPKLSNTQYRFGDKTSSSYYDRRY